MMDQSSLSRKGDHLFVGVFVLLVLFRIWLILGIPKYYIDAPLDDLYYARAAHYVIHGQWMGPYDENTLIKAPFYAIFLIASFLTGLPLFVNETAFYILGCLVLYVSLRPLIQHRWCRLLLLTVLLFLPACLTTPWTLRVYREFVYFSLSLFVVSTSLGLWLRIREPVSSTLIWAIGLGLSVGAFMITREEGIWILPMLFLILIICMVSIWKQKLNRRRLRFFILAVSVVLWSLPTLIVSYLNWSYYGFWGVSENTDQDLNRVLNDVYRIRTSEWKPFEPVTRQVLGEAYDVSPLFKELQPTIDSRYDALIPYSDATLSAKPRWYQDAYFVRGEVLAGGHFLWLFRLALGKAGYYSSGHYPREYLRQVADQLDTACDSGALDCYQGMRIPFAGAFRPEQIPLMFHFFGDYFSQLLTYKEMAFSDQRSLDLATWAVYGNAMRYFEEFAYNPLGNEYFGNTNLGDQLVDGKIDLRLKALEFRHNLILGIYSFYKSVSLAFSLVSVVGFVIVISYYGKIGHWPYSGDVLVVILLVLGFLLSRLLTLAILDATSSIPAIHYATSSYIYLYLTMFLIGDFVWVNFRRIVVVSGANTGHPPGPDPTFALGSGHEDK